MFTTFHGILQFSKEMHLLNDETHDKNHLIAALMEVLLLTILLRVTITHSQHLIVQSQQGKYQNNV